jgi:hypothetical protein
MGQRVQAGVLAQEQRREPGLVRQVEDQVEPRPPQVGIHEHHAPAGLRERNGEVGRRDGLALSRDRARDEEGADRGVDRRELDVGRSVR